mmetsp:Transcript_7129/g.15664  ORF Transcript_7129/g.15664 Transcript_7129/m.15664 type:complete len:445 (+) Transcript_7129:115-1449(+)
MEEQLSFIPEREDEEQALSLEYLETSQSISSHRNSSRACRLSVRALATSGILAAAAGACCYMSTRSSSTSTNVFGGEVPKDSDVDFDFERTIVEFEENAWETRKHHQGFHRFINETLHRSYEVEPLKDGQTHDKIFARFLSATSEHGEKKPLVPVKEKKEMMCTLDIVQSVAALGSSIYYLFLAIASPHGRGCVKNEEYTQVACANVIEHTLLAWGIATFLLSASMSDCAQTLNAPAACASDVTGMTLALVAWSNFGTNVKRYCVDPFKTSEQVKAHIHEQVEEKVAEKKEEHRQHWLEKTGLNKSALVAFMHEAHEHHQEYLEEKKDIDYAKFKISECVMKIFIGGGFAIRAIVEMIELGEACENPEKCGYVVTAIIGIWAQVAGSFASASYYCDPAAQKADEKMCAATISGFVAGFGFFPPMLSAAGRHCAKVEAALKAGGR